MSASAGWVTAGWVVEFRRHAGDSWSRRGDYATRRAARAAATLVLRTAGGADHAEVRCIECVSSSPFLTCAACGVAWPEACFWRRDKPLPCGGRLLSSRRRDALCKLCRSEMRERLRAARAEAGFCAELGCTSPPAPGGRACEACRVLARERRRRFRERRRARATA